MEEMLKSSHCQEEDCCHTSTSPPTLLQLLPLLLSLPRAFPVAVLVLVIHATLR